MSHNLLKFKVLPHIKKGTPLFFVLIDNLRFDQWKAIQPIFAESFRIHEEETFYSILPTATQYSRNAIFAGMLPIEIEKQFSFIGNIAKLGNILCNDQKEKNDWKNRNPFRKEGREKAAEEK
jgi:hypothetical protein